MFVFMYVCMYVSMHVNIVSILPSCHCVVAEVSAPYSVVGLLINNTIHVCNKLYCRYILFLIMYIVLRYYKLLRFAK